MSEILKRIVREDREDIVRQGESFHRLGIYCPHCGKNDAVIEAEDYPMPYGGWEECQCTHCEKSFQAKAGVVYSTRKCK